MQGRHLQKLLKDSLQAIKPIADAKEIWIHLKDSRKLHLTLLPMAEVLGPFMFIICRQEIEIDKVTGCPS